jgi:hypothetical protein
MDFEDAILVRLADPSTRDAVFDQDGLAAIAAAGYDHPELEGPYTAVFEQLDVAVDVTPPARVEGTWQRVGDALPVELRVTVSGLPETASAQLTALWRGAVVARVVPATTPVTAAAAAPVDADQIDAAVVAALGSLPGDPAELEAARREQVRAMLATATGRPVLADDEQFSRWLELVGADSVGAWLALGSRERSPEYVRVAFGPGTNGTAPRRLPLTVAVLARGAPASLAGLLADTALLRRRLDEGGYAPAPDPALRQRFPVVVAWVLAASVFDDADWPGGDSGSAEQRRRARRTAAAAWLAERGIAIATVDSP